MKSICPWFEHCTNPPPSPPTWSFRTKPWIHSLTPIKDKENMPPAIFSLPVLWILWQITPLTKIPTLSGPNKQPQPTKQFPQKTELKKEIRKWLNPLKNLLRGASNADQGRTFLSFLKAQAIESKSVMAGLWLCFCTSTGHHLCGWDPHHDRLHPGGLHHAGFWWFFLCGGEPQHCRPARLSG